MTFQPSFAAKPLFAAAMTPLVRKADACECSPIAEKPMGGTVVCSGIRRRERLHRTTAIALTWSFAAKIDKVSSLV